jgi:uncharacterized protein (DUF1499 family)
MFKVFLVVVLLAVAIVFFTLYRNGANLTEPPGVVKRLAVFLSINKASTADNHPLAELRTPTFNIDAKTLYAQVLDAAADLGWAVLAHDSDALDANLVVRSPALLFADDIYVQVKSMGDQQSSLQIRSASRKGSADFAANSGHIQKLVKQLRIKVSK